MRKMSDFGRMSDSIFDFRQENDILEDSFGFTKESRVLEKFWV